jgi:hypothetical protein
LRSDVGARVLDPDQADLPSHAAEAVMLFLGRSGAPFSPDHSPPP